VTDRAVIGARLRAEREAHGWSRVGLASRMRRAAAAELPDVESLAHMVKEWECGKHGVSERYQGLYARVLGVSEATLFGVDVGAADPWQMPGPRVSPDDEERLTLAAARPARIDDGVVESLAVILAEQRRLEDAVGSAPVLYAVRAQLAALAGLVAGARGPVRPRLVDVTAQWAQFSGWLNIAVGDAPAARTSLDRAAEHAEEIGDVDMVGTVLSWKANLAERSGQVGPMIGLAGAARRNRTGPGRAYDVFQEARGHALAGDTRTSERLLREAREAAADARPEAARPWEYYYLEPGFFTLETGLTYLYLGELDRRWTAAAVEHLTSGLDELPATMQRSEWSGEFRYRLGRAYLQGEESDRAVVLARDLSALATQLGSSRLSEQAEELERATERA
jgi:transcriptional regulator with XRE-family HTH domain